MLREIRNGFLLGLVFIATFIALTIVRGYIM